MPARKLTRRQTLLAAAGGLLGTAGARWPALAAASRADATTRLMPPSADVWAQALQVSGSPSGARLTVGGQPVGTTRQGSGFAAEVPIGPGATEVSATSNGPRGSATRVYTGRVPDRPTAQVALSAGSGVVSLDASASQVDPYSGAALASVTWSRRDGSEIGSGTQLELRGAFSDGEHYVTATVTDVNGRSDDTTVVFVVSAGQPAAVDLAGWQADWVENAVVYGAIPPLFGSPPLQALASSLDRLAALGVNVVWLAPIFATVPGDFGYAVTDYFTVRPDYGDLASLQALVAAAHARGLRVILDLPLNDTSAKHPYFLQTREAGDSSHYWDFYERTAQGKAVHYFDWRQLPNLQYANPEVRRMATEAAAYWVRVADIDGFRCDAAWGVQERAPDFWPTWCAELKRIRPDLLLLAESTARESWPAAAGFSAAYDWNEELGVWAWDRAFAKKRQVASRLSQALAVPDATRAFRFLENNDTGARFVTRYGLPMTRAAAALLLALPGIPCIYTGQEIGAEYDPYRREAPLDWSADPHGLQALYRGLIEQRRGEPQLATGTLQLVDVTPADRVVAFTVAAAGVQTLVAVNFSGVDVRATVEIAGEAPRTLDVAPWSAFTAPAG
jgi:glycosidase